MADTLRLIGGGLLALICVYVGIIVRRRYKNREKFFAELVAFCGVLKTEIGYKKTSIPDVCREYVKTASGDFGKLVSSYLDGLYHKTAMAFDGIEYVGGEQKILQEFFDGLGKTSLNDQLAFVEKFNGRFGAIKDKCSEESKRLGGMYFKLLVLLGLALLVLTI